MAANIGSQVLELTHELTSAIETELNPAIAAIVHSMDQAQTDIVHWADELRKQLHEFEDSAKSHCEQIKSAITQKSEELSTLFAEIDSKADEVTGHVEDAQGACAEALETFEHGRDEVLTGCDEIASATDAMLEASNEAVASFEGHVENAIEGFVGEHSALDEAADQLLADAKSMFEKLNDGLTTMDDTVSGEFEKATSTLDDEVTAMLSAQESSASGNESQTAHAVHDVLGAAEGFMKTAEELDHALTGDLGQVISKVEGVAHLLQQIRPVIQLIESVA